MTVKKFAASLCTGAVTPVTYTMNACVATPATSSTLSLGYSQWTYATATTAPLLLGYLSFMTFSISNVCRAPIMVQAVSLNKCLIGFDGYPFIATVSEYSYTYISTQYSDSKCTLKTGIYDSDKISLNSCTGYISNIGSSTPFQLMTDNLMVMRRYFSRLILPLSYRGVPNRVFLVLFSISVYSGSDSSCTSVPALYTEYYELNTCISGLVYTVAGSYQKRKPSVIIT